MVKRGVFLGRFQPFHLGHLNALKWILKREEEVVICIGSSQFSYSLENPFSLGERIEMIWRILKYEKLTDKCIITSVPDSYGQRHLWAQLLVTHCPKFDIVYTNDKLSQLLLSDYGIKVSPIPMFKRDLYKATVIREKMIRGEEWKKYLHPTTVRYLLEIKGIERIRKLASQ